MKLTIKQENFCNYYIECGNASEAYRRAYSCGKMSDKTIWEVSSKLLKDNKVATRVKELQDEQKEQSDLTKDRILAELSNIAFSSIAHLHNTWIERKDFESLTEKQKSSIKSISTKILKKNVGTNEDVEYVKVELYDKIKAIERICKMLGYDEPTVLDLRNALVQIDTGID